MSVQNSDQIFMQTSRAEQRRLKLLEAERECAAEEAEALTLTEEQREMLFRPFAAVKAEFSDLDGLRWTQTALRRRQPSHHLESRATHTHQAHEPKITNNSAFAVLTNADLATFAPDDTIRISPFPSHTRPRFPSPLIRGTTNLPGTHIPMTESRPPHPPNNHRDGSRNRSPVKGLFNAPPSDGESDDISRVEYTPRPSLFSQLPTMDPHSEYDGLSRPQAPNYAHSHTGATTTSSPQGTSRSPQQLYYSSASIMDPPLVSNPSSTSASAVVKSHPKFSSHLTRSTSDLTVRAPRSHTSTPHLSVLTAALPDHLSSSASSPAVTPLPRRRRTASSSSSAFSTPTVSTTSSPVETLSPFISEDDADEAKDYDSDADDLSLLERPRPSLRRKGLARSASVASFYTTDTTSKGGRGMSKSPRARLASLLAHTGTHTDPSQSRSRAASLGS